MTSKSFAFPVLLLSFLISVFGLECPLGLSTPGNQSHDAVPAGSSQQTVTDVSGIWSGAFQSNLNFPPFSMTVVINRDSRGHIIGTSTLDSDCLKDARLQVTVSGSNIVLAGSDKEGDNATFRGTIDSTGTQLTFHYIFNSSASGRCETDDGTGTLGKR